MIRISKQEAQKLREKNLGEFIHSTTGHHKSWYAVESFSVLRELGKLPPKKKK